MGRSVFYNYNLSCNILYIKGVRIFLMKNKIDKSVWITGMIVLGAIIIVLSVVGFFKGGTGYNTISSTGESSISVMPDFVSVYFNIQTEGGTAEEANSENSQIYDSLKNSLMAIGFEEDEIQTQGFSVYPNYDYGSETREITGYTASHSIFVRTDLENRNLIGQTIDAGISSGAGISHINYELAKENQSDYKAEAIRLATEDATTKAEALAEGAGKRLGRLVSVSTSDFYYQPWRVFSGADGSAESVTSSDEIVTQISPGEQEITARVTASFRIR